MTAADDSSASKIDETKKRTALWSAQEIVELFSSNNATMITGSIVASLCLALIGGGKNQDAKGARVARKVR
jgi:hypothetical protein